MKITGAEIVVNCLQKEKVKYLFCYQGGSVITIFDELYKIGENINLIRSAHEQCLTHAADAFARASGDIGVVVVTSGPGAANTITGIANAYLDSVPMVIITGQVSSDKIGTDAFQEVDIVGITSSITKAGFLVTDVRDLANTIKTAFYLAKTGRKGPVLIDIPVDLLKEKTEFVYPEKIHLPGYNPTYKGNDRQILSALKLLKKAKKPLIIAGGGVISSNSSDLVNKFAQRQKIPTVHTVMGSGVSPLDPNLNLGLIGMHGKTCGNYAVQSADVILALGTRFNDRITNKIKYFCPKAKIIHIDIDPAEIGKNKAVYLPIVGKIEHIVAEFLEKSEESQGNKDWLDLLSKMKKDTLLKIGKDKDKIYPQRVIKYLSDNVPKNSIIVTDVGQHQMWVAQGYNFTKPRTLITSGGLGTMGFGLPASVGAKISSPDTPVFLVAGDGGFQMTMQDLITVKNYELPIKIIVLDNSALGMVKQWQKLLCKNRYSGTILDKNPNFVQVSKAYGIDAISCQDPKEINSKLDILINSKNAMLLHIIIDKNEDVMPMIPPGLSLHEGITKIK